MVEPRVAVVTGASAGIGKATADAFARMGWRVIGTGRDPERCAQAEVQLRAEAFGNARIDILQGDFCEMTDVARMAEEIALLTDSVDILINNAGGIRDARYTTSEGLEATLAANHVAPFLLTQRLLPLLTKAAAKHEPGHVRVITVSSAAHERCPGMNWDDLNLEQDFTNIEAYCQAKLANLLFSRELNQRVNESGIIAQAMHPGIIHSNFASHADEDLQEHLNSLPGETPEHAARTLIWMATAPDVGTYGGRYFHEMAEVPAAPQAQDDEAAARLWRETENMLLAISD